MPSRLVRSILSLIIAVHLVVVSLAVLAHRGVSYLHDELLTAVAPYAAIGNWRVDFNRIPLANSNHLGEFMKVEIHLRGEPAELWKPLAIDNRADLEDHSCLSRVERLEQFWLQQLSGLLFYENDEGVGQMLTAAIKRSSASQKEPIDKIRVTVAPRPSLEEFSTLENKSDLSSLGNSFQPQVAYLATVIDLGEGNLSLLRQLESRRASKSMNPSSQPAGKGGSRP